MITATTQGYLYVKSDRINRTLDEAIELAESTDEVITTKDLATILKSIQKRVASELTARI